MPGYCAPRTSGPQWGMPILDKIETRSAPAAAVPPPRPVPGWDLFAVVAGGFGLVRAPARQPPVADDYGDEYRDTGDHE